MEAGAGEEEKGEEHVLMRAQAPYEVHYLYMDKTADKRTVLEFREIYPSRCNDLGKAVLVAKEQTVTSERPLQAEVKDSKTGRIKFRQTTDGAGNLISESFV